MTVWFQDSKQRSIFWIAFYISVILAWIMMIIMSFESKISKDSFLYAICVSPSEFSTLSVVAMWILMMAAMMMPSFQSHVQTHMDIMSSSGRVWPSAQLMFGYASVWLVVAFAGALLQQRLDNIGLVDSSGRSLSLRFNGLLCILAAWYQFSDWKTVCLNKCTSPMQYFVRHWIDGPIGSFKMGLHLGIWCAGCCWALMLLAFVGGTMNALWMALVTGLIVFEKFMPNSKKASFLLGQTLIGLSLIMFILSIFLEIPQ